MPSRSRKSRWSFAAIVLLVFAALLVSSLQSPAIKKLAFQWSYRAGLTHPMSLELARPVVHISMFAVAGIFLGSLGNSRRQARMVPILLLAAAVMSEFMQSHVYESPFEWWDVMADATGLLIAISLSGWFRNRRGGVVDGAPGGKESQCTSHL